MRQTASNLLILTGLAILILSGLFLWRRNDPGRLQFTGEYISESKNPDALVVPTGIVMQDAGIKLPIVPADTNGEYWETTPEGVSYLLSSAIPGEQGNSIFYGHNWGSSLGNLHKVRVGQIVEIYFSDGTTRRFQIAYIQEVKPDNISVLAETNDRRITVYTCSGLFDQNRLVVTAFLI